MKFIYTELDRDNLLEKEYISKSFNHFFRYIH